MYSSYSISSVLRMRVWPGWFVSSNVPLAYPVYPDVLKTTRTSTIHVIMIVQRPGHKTRSLQVLDIVFAVKISS